MQSATKLGELTIKPDAAEFRVASEWLTREASATGIPQERIELLDLCLNEALANAVSYGGEPALSAELNITLSVNDHADFDSREVVVTLSDAGVPFDPTTAEAKPRPLDLASAELGGHGLVILRSLADSLSYAYQGGRNVISFGVRWAADK
jgi:serine/threonine-protein kinase RsbW